MEALMGSSSPYLKLVSCRDNNLGFLSFKDHLLPKSHLIHLSPNHSTNKLVHFKLSISHRGLRPAFLSSSQTQAEVDNPTEESPNGYTIEAETQTVGVQFQLHRECSFGQNFLITGDHPVLGLWDPNNAISLTWSDGHIWTVDLDLPVGTCIKFKLIMQESNGIFVWQPGPDRVLECFQTEKIITLCEDWENPDARIILETNPTMDQEIQFVDTQEPKGYAINMDEALVSDEGVPVLVPGLSQLPINEGPKDEPEPVAMVSTGPDMAKYVKLPELDLKGDTANNSNSNPRSEISSIHENQESCENKHQEMEVAEEQDHEGMRSLLHNDIEWSSNVMHKFLNIFGIQ